VSRAGVRLLRLAWIGAIVCAVRAGADPVTDLVTRITSAGDSSRIGELIQYADYGVPGSPAFELLPEQPSEVVHALTPKDFLSQIRTWTQGGKLKLGVAADTRPFVRSGGTLAQYQASRWRQALFRTVLSVGIAANHDHMNDAVFATGLRFALWDNGDPRRREVVSKVEQSYLNALGQLGPPPADASREELAARSARASKAADATREVARRNYWNAFKVDLGLAGSAGSHGAATEFDSLEQNRAGVWLAASLPVGSWAQLTGSGKASWARADSVTQETQRQSAGVLLRAFPTAQLSLAFEASRLHQRYELDGRNRWTTRLAGAAEMYVGELKGWVGVGYGADPNGKEEKATLYYALYHVRKLENVR
jgi:hypothetical protein